jgi:hypothetical protein
LTSGHIDSGVQALRDVLSAVGIRYPGSSLSAIASLLWHGCRIRRRGLSYRQRPPESLAEHERRKLQAHWTAVAGLSVIDPVRAADFASRYLLDALRIGDLTHLERAMTAHSGHVAAGGYRNRRRVDALLERIDAIAGADGMPYALATAAIARGAAAHLQSRYGESVRCCDQAAAGLLDPKSRAIDPRCLDVTWELNLARSFGMWSLMYMGDIAELTRRQPEVLRLAEERNDLFATLNFGTQITTYVLLGRDRPDDARRRLEEDGRRLSKLGYFVQHQNHLLAMAFLEQYCGDGRAAWRHMQDAQRAYSGSLLSHVQHMRIDFLQARGRAALAAARQSGDAALMKQAEQTARRLRGENTPWAAAMSAFLCAGIAAARRQADVEQYLTNAIAQLIEVNGRLFAAAARVRLAQVRKSGADAADDEMRRLGVRNPQRMTAALLPGFENG